MVGGKLKKAIVTTAKKNITASNVRIENGQFVDEDGNIANRIADELPTDADEFTIRISVEVADEGNEE